MTRTFTAQEMKELTEYAKTHLPQSVLKQREGGQDLTLDQLYNLWKEEYGIVTQEPKGLDSSALKARYEEELTEKSKQSTKKSPVTHKHQAKVDRSPHRPFQTNVINKTPWGSKMTTHTVIGNSGNLVGNPAGAWEQIDNKSQNNPPVVTKPNLPQLPPEQIENSLQRSNQKSLGTAPVVNFNPKTGELTYSTSQSSSTDNGMNSADRSDIKPSMDPAKEYRTAVDPNNNLQSSMQRCAETCDKALPRFPQNMKTGNDLQPKSPSGKNPNSPNEISF